MITTLASLVMGVATLFVSKPATLLSATTVAEIPQIEIPTVELSTVLQNTAAIYKLSLEAGLSVASTTRLQTIAKCESSLKQFNDDGTLYLGEVNSADVGLFQINTDYSPRKAVKDKTGLDIYTLEGNIKYAIMLYKKNGTQPWYLSKPCWSSVTL